MVEEAVVVTVIVGLFAGGAGAVVLGTGVFALTEVDVTLVAGIGALVGMVDGGCC